jgi:tetratricopeptide (TPR) repeat protein
MYYRGLLLLALKKPDESTAELQAAAATADLAPALKANALRLVAIRQRERDEADAAAKTLTALEDLVGPTGMSLDEQIWMGRHQLKAGKPQESLRQLKPILEGRVRTSKPQRTEALLMAADALRQLKDLKAAMQAYREVIAMGHGMGLQARLELARTMVAADELEGAIDEFKGLYTADETAIAAAALYDAAQVHRRLAQQRLRETNTQGVQEQLEAARANLKRLVLLYAFPELSPLPELSYIDLGNLSLERGDAEAAKAEWNELLEKFPEGAYATYAKAMLAAQSDQRQVAMGLLTELRGRQLDPRLMERVNERIKALESRS